MPQRERHRESAFFHTFAMNYACGVPVWYKRVLVYVYTCLFLLWDWPPTDSRPSHPLSTIGITQRVSSNISQEWQDIRRNFNQIGAWFLSVFISWLNLMDHQVFIAVIYGFRIIFCANTLQIGKSHSPCALDINSKQINHYRFIVFSSSIDTLDETINSVRQHKYK